MGRLEESGGLALERLTLIEGLSETYEPTGRLIQLVLAGRLGPNSAFA